MKIFVIVVRKYKCFRAIEIERVLKRNFKNKNNNNSNKKKLKN